MSLLTAPGRGHWLTRYMPYRISDNTRIPNQPPRRRPQGPNNNTTTLSAILFPTHCMLFYMQLPLHQTHRLLPRRSHHRHSTTASCLRIERQLSILTERPTFTMLYHTDHDASYPPRRPSRVRLSLLPATTYLRKTPDPAPGGCQRTYIFRFRGR